MRKLHPLHSFLFFPPNPLRWASAGAPYFSKFPVDFDFLLTSIRVLLTDLDFLDQHHCQLPGEGLQLQQFPGFVHDLLLIAGLLLTGELLIDLGQPPLQAALFL